MTYANHAVADWWSLGHVIITRLKVKKTHQQLTHTVPFIKIVNY